MLFYVYENMLLVSICKVCHVVLIGLLLLWLLKGNVVTGSSTADHFSTGRRTRHRVWQSTTILVRQRAQHPVAPASPTHCACAVTKTTAAAAVRPSTPGSNRSEEQLLWVSTGVWAGRRPPDPGHRPATDIYTRRYLDITWYTPCLGKSRPLLLCGPPP